VTHVGSYLQIGCLKTYTDKLVTMRDKGMYFIHWKVGYKLWTIKYEILKMVTIQVKIVLIFWKKELWKI